MSKETVAEYELRKLKISDAINVNYDKHSLYKRAMHVFFVSYVGYDRIADSNALFNTNLSDYQRVMMDVFGVTNDKLYANDVKNSSMNGEIIVCVAIIKAIDIKKLTNPVIAISCDNSKRNVKTIKLDSNKEIQDNLIPTSFAFRITYFADLRVKNEMITIALQSSAQRFKDFRISYRDIHVEGFRDWFEFSSDIKLLISIQFRIKTETNSAHNHSEIHRQLILHSLRNRIKKFNDSNLDITNTLISYPSKKTETLQKRVEHNTQNAYWMTSATTNLPFVGKYDEYVTQQQQSEGEKHVSFIGFLKSRQIIGNKVKYHDLHITSNISDEISEESFCVCCEWCNLNAFFYHNPILRFLLVQHHQLYVVLDSVTIPDTYLLICSHLLTDSKVRTPLFQLLKSAKEFSETNYTQKLVDKKYELEYKNSCVHKLQGIAYNLVRHHVKLVEVLAMTSKSVFSDVVIEWIRNYFEVFEYLHYRVSEVNTFVIQKDRVLEKWYEEYENETRVAFHKIIELAYKRVTTEKHVLHSEDILFNIDYNMFASVEKDKGMTEVIRWRNKVRELTANPYNAKFTCDQMLSFIICLNNLIQRIEPILPGINEPYEEREEMVFATVMDEKMNRINVNACKANIVKTDKQLPLEDVYYYKYFTLKCYDIGVCLQQYFIHAITYYNEKNFNVNHFASKELHFVYRNEWIEASLKSKFSDQFMFNDSKDMKMLDNVFNKFYFALWSQGLTQITAEMTVNSVANSVEMRYAKLYLWWKANGNHRTIFTDIIKTVNKNVDSVCQRSEHIFHKDILKVYRNDKTRYEYKTEVIDLLVYWLVKADCFMHISIVAHFLKLIHKLQDERLVRRKKSFTQSYPGLIFLLRTYDQSVIRSLHQIKLLYIDYDDEFNRIAKVLGNTKKIVKNLYCDVYRKLCYNWIKETDFLLLSGGTSDKKLLIALACNTCVGAHFMYTFFNDFRVVCHAIRSRVETRYIEKFRYDQTIPKQIFVKCWELAKQWIRERNEMERPLLANCWRSYLANTFKHFESSYHLNQFRINLKELPLDDK